MQALFLVQMLVFMLLLNLSTLKLNLIVGHGETRNPFVEYAVQYSVAAAYATFDQNKKDALHKLLLQGLDITILGSNNFYSYRNEVIFSCLYTFCSSFFSSFLH